MKLKEMTPWKQRGLFFILGLTIALIQGLLLIKWMDLARFILTEPNLGHDQQPLIFHRLEKIIICIPWFMILLVIVFRVTKGRQFRVFSYIIGTTLPTAILISFMLFGPYLSDYIHHQKFNAELWRKQSKATIDSDWPARLCMVDDLKASGRLNELNKQEVIKLLGKPDDTNHFSEQQKDCISYELGPERGLFRIDSEWLYIFFDEEGNVISY